MPLGIVFDKLLKLPLFQGMSRNDLNQVVARTRFGFLRVTRGKTLVSEGEACQHIYFLTNGSLCAESRSDDGSYSITETVTSPGILQPDRIFGLHQRFTKTFTALEDCELMRIDKQQVLALVAEQEIFRYNLLNIISTQSQRISHQPWQQPPTTIRRKVIRFIENHSLRPAGPKTLHVRMETLARLIGESRLNLSRELNLMADEGLITLRRSAVHVDSLEKLLAL